MFYFRTKIMQNIGIVFVKMGQYNDAITSFEHIMSEAPSFKTGFNLILCYFALGDREKMKRAFQKLLTVDLKVDDEDKYLTHSVSILYKYRDRFMVFNSTFNKISVISWLSVLLVKETGVPGENHKQNQTKLIVAKTKIYTDRFRISYSILILALGVKVSIR